MKNVFLFAFLLSAHLIHAQGFTVSPYQDLGLWSPLVADFTGDSLPDVFGLQFNPAQVVLQVNAGATPIAFTAKNLNLNFEPAGWPAAADMDGDNDLDIVIAQGTAKYLYLLLNDGAGNFTPDSLGVSGSEILKVGDAEHDGDLDIFGFNYAAGTVHLYTNDGSQHFTHATVVGATTNLEVFDTGDLDGDGDLDIVLGISQFSGKQLSIYQNMGGNTFQEKVVASDNFASVADLVIDDLNNDGKKDVVAVRQFFDCTVFLNQGNLSFQRKNLFSGSGLIQKVLTGDYNGDGRKDIVVGYNSVDMTWHKNLSNATLEFNTQTVGGVTPVYAVANGDLDGDKDLDLVVTNGEFWWYENGVSQEVGTITLPEREIEVFPNPFFDHIQLKNLGSDSYEIGITDAAGRQVYASTVHEACVRLPHLGRGTYFLRLINTTTGEAGAVLLLKRE